MPTSTGRLVRAGGAVAVLIAAGAPGAAQQLLGSTFRTTPSTASRGGLLGTPGILVARFDRDDYVGWGRTTAVPNRRAIHGVRFDAEDADGATPEGYSVVVYTEDPANPGFPLTAAPLRTIGPFVNPPQPAGRAFFQTTHRFAPPVEVPADRDVFVGVRLDPANGWPLDGHTVQCVLGAPSRWPIHDAPGPAPIQHGSYGLTIQSTGAAAYATTRQLAIDLLCDAPGACCTAITNQQSYAISNSPPGAGGFLSALHPDAARPSRNPARADAPGFVFLDASLPNGTLIVFLADVGAFGQEVPLAASLPGSVGVFCLNPAAVSLGIALSANGQAARTLAIPAWIRPQLGAFPLTQQAIALLPNGTLRASPCGRQVF
jgi:hypothetical protein